MSNEFIGSIHATNPHKKDSSKKETLSVETRAKLEDLGIDTSEIKTEEQGKKALDLALSSIDNNKKTNSQTSTLKNKNILLQAKSLAKKIGINSEQNNDIKHILANISIKINQLRVEAKDNHVKSAKLAYYQMEYNTIYAEYLEVLNSQSQLSKAMNTLANYNKIYQNLG